MHQQNVRYNSYNLIILLYSSTTVLGIISGSAFMVYYLLKSNLLVFIMSIICLVTGVSSGVYLERKTKEKESENKPSY